MIDAPGPPHDGAGGRSLLFLAIAAIAFYLRRRWKGPNLVANVEAASSHFRGKVVPLSWGRSRLEFQVDGVPAEVTYRRTGLFSSEITRIRFRHPLAGFLRIVPIGTISSLRNIGGTREIKLGEPSFDTCFHLEGTPENWVREVLGHEARSRISLLGALGASERHADHVGLDAGPGGSHDLERPLLCE
jgi:hypothetical protein